jgi:hypothetical protein
MIRSVRRLAWNNCALGCGATSTVADMLFNNINGMSCLQGGLSVQWFQIRRAWQ